MADHPATTEPKRRSWQFRLRTLLILVVLLGVACAYVGHEAKIVAERRAFIEVHEGACVFPYEKAGWLVPHPDKAPSFIRRWLGDRAVLEIFVSPEIDHAEELFPEAEVGIRPQTTHVLPQP